MGYSKREKPDKRRKEKEVQRMGKGLDIATLSIAIIGTLNWGLVGLFNFNLVTFLFGGIPWVARIIYILVGICGLYLFTFMGRDSREA